MSPPRRTPASSDLLSGEIYLEHVRIGAYAKVSAIHAATGVEVSVTGPVSANPRDLEQLAVRKLARQMQKRDDDKR